MISHHKSKGTEYWIYNDKPNLPVIIMIHGLRGTHHGLELVANRLNNYRVIIPDLPGFGASEPLNDTHTIDNYADWLENFIRHLKLKEQPVLLGHSFGSIITSRFAAKYPGKIRNLIVVNPIGAPALEGPRGFLSKLTKGYYWLGKVLPEKASTKLLSSRLVVLLTSAMLAKTRNKDLRKYIHSQHLQHFSSFRNRRVIDETFSESISNTVCDSAAQIPTPTLLIVGDIDDITPLSKQKQLVKMFPNAKLEIINQVGHLTHYETPDEIVKAINQFIRKPQRAR